MIKELADKYIKISILCKSQDEFIKFIEDATTEMEFSRTVNYQRIMLSKKAILKYKDKYIKPDESVIILIEKREYRYHTDYNIHTTRIVKNLYTENEYKQINYSPFFRKEKIEKIKRRLCLK